MVGQLGKPVGALRIGALGLYHRPKEQDVKDVNLPVSIQVIPPVIVGIAEQAVDSMFE
jgi:hypothetical protein